jgi:hypothetical protein
MPRPEGVTPRASDIVRFMEVLARQNHISGTVQGFRVGWVRAKLRWSYASAILHRGAVIPKLSSTWRFM